MITVMFTCPRCGQRAAVETSQVKDVGVPGVPCAVCGAAMEPVQRVCDCGKEMGSNGSR